MPGSRSKNTPRPCIGGGGRLFASPRKREPRVGECVVREPQDGLADRRRQEFLRERSHVEVTQRLVLGQGSGLLPVVCELERDVAERSAGPREEGSTLR